MRKLSMERGLYRGALVVGVLALLAWGIGQTRPAVALPAEKDSATTDAKTTGATAEADICRRHLKTISEAKPAVAPGESGAASSGDDTPGNFASALEEYQALVKKYQKAQEEFSKVYSAAKTDADRQAAMSKYPQPQNYTARFLQLAEKNPNDPAAVDALSWVALNGRFGPDFEKAINRLLRDHITDKKLGQVCQSLAYAQSPSAEKLLREALEKNPDHSAQGQACFSLAQVLQRRSSADAEKYFNQVIEKFGDVPHDRGTLADAAKSQLFEIHNLGIGKTAPEIEGEDIDGKKFKLSDYRGKVLVLDFWGDW